MVALLLLVTYRSPWLWLVPLTVVGVADQVAAKLLAVGTHVFGFAVDGATTGITSVLVFGAGTNYALLIIARYREELRREESRYDAMRVALDRAVPAIVASSGTVVLALLCLGFADNPSSRSIGFGGAIGIVDGGRLRPARAPRRDHGLRPRAVLAVRAPGRPARADRDRVWATVARVVTSRPRLVSAVGVLVLVALALPLAGLDRAVADRAVPGAPESVVGQEVLARHFPAGASQPTSVLVPAGSAAAVCRAVGGVDGVQRVERAGGDDASTTELSVVLGADPGSQAAFDDVRAVRDAAQRWTAPGAGGRRRRRGARRQGRPPSTTSGWSSR